jgi:hypothetical protein
MYQRATLLLGIFMMTTPLSAGEANPTWYRKQATLAQTAAGAEALNPNPVEFQLRLRELLHRDFPKDLRAWERARFLGIAAPVAAKGASLPAKADTVFSHLLGRDLRLAPSFGSGELSFFGSGRVGAGGSVDGEWNHLIGPVYSSPDFIASERLALQIGTANSIPLLFSMRRIAGSGVLFARAEISDLVIELYEFAPWDGIDAIRLVHVHNPGSTPVSGVRLNALVRAHGTAAIEGNQLVIRIPASTRCFGGETPNWAPRTAYLAWSGTGSDVEPGFALRCGSVTLPALGGVTRALVHRVNWATEAKPLPEIDLGKAALETALAEWNAWFARGDADLPAHPRLGLLFESQLAFIRMQQSYDGGLIAGIRRYAYSYLRDMHGAARGFLAAGHTDEVRREMEWIDEKFRTFKNFVNASEMGASIKQHLSGHPGTELPAYYLLMARGYLARKGDPAAIDRLREGLQFAADIQIQTSRADGWRFRFNGDETEYWMPSKENQANDGAHHGFEGACWSMPSHALAMVSVDYFARELAPRWKIDPTTYHAAVAEWSKSFAATFQPDQRSTPYWTVQANGQPTANPVLVNYLCFPGWVQAPFAPEECSHWAWAAAWFLRQDGLLPMIPGRVESTTGHSLALLLSAMQNTGTDREVADYLVNVILGSGMIKHYGLVTEYCSPKGIPTANNLRPFESGPLLDALAQWVRTAKP